MQLIGNEVVVRMWAASFDDAIAHGGIAFMAQVSGLSTKTISRGIDQLYKEPNDVDTVPAGRSRQPGGGRPSAEESQPDLIEALKRLVDPVTRGDPCSKLRSASKSTRELAKELNSQGFTVSHTVTGKQFCPKNGKTNSKLHSNRHL
jgi:hypothetical protein